MAFANYCVVETIAGYLGHITDLGLGPLSFSVGLQVGCSLVPPGLASLPSFALHSGNISYISMFAIYSLLILLSFAYFSQLES